MGIYWAIDLLPEKNRCLSWTGSLSYDDFYDDVCSSFPINLSDLARIEELCGQGEEACGWSSDRHYGQIGHSLLECRLSVWSCGGLCFPVLQIDEWDLIWRDSIFGRGFVRRLNAEVCCKIWVFSLLNFFYGTGVVRISR